MKIDFNTKGFDFLRKGIGKDYKTRVGIIGSAASKVHKGTGLTNALIGSVHEFGSISRGIPRRSFIKMPLEKKIMFWVRKNKDRYIKLCQSGDPRLWFVALGLAAEGIIDEGFKTRGFGQWQPDAIKTVKRKGSNMPLIDTGELRRSISTKVITGKK